MIFIATKWRVDNAEDKGSLLPKSDSRYSSFGADEKTTIGKFIKVTFTVENLSGETVTWPDKPTLVDNQNRAYDASTDCWEWIPEELSWSSTDLQPNLPKQFVLIYEIPSGATGLSLKVNDLTSSFLSDPKTALISLGI